MTRDESLAQMGLWRMVMCRDWSVWSSAEASLADACQFAGGPVPDGGFGLGSRFFCGSYR